jgi:hypothetical protein
LIKNKIIILETLKYRNYVKKFVVFIFYNLIFEQFKIILAKKGIGDWGLGIGDWGLGIGDWAQSPIPNPQSPIPNSFNCILSQL